ncbi:MAG TPA: putative sulfate exporter family transporter [Sediminibacterium sp.]|nr:putative sulfate exporter family transporter [Sediminibacterium sp.]
MDQAPAIRTPEKPGRSLLDRSFTAREIIFLAAAAFCLSPLISPPGALLMGLIAAQLIGHPYLHLNHKATHILLQVSVVGLGFGMNVNSAVKAGKEGIGFAFVSIIGTLTAGFLLGKFLKIEQKTSYLIAAGTAICGGSAIATIAPVIKAEEKQISVALGTVFILNSIALFLFPFTGHLLHLSQTAFGLWSAIAIHDTSSVVGAASRYGAQALEAATTVKLTRTLWIIPLALISAFIYRNKDSKIKIPYFIGWFIVAVVLNTYIPFVRQYGHSLTGIAKAGLTLTLFLIGSGLSGKLLLSVGLRPLIQGVLLWMIVSAATLWAVVALI